MKSICLTILILSGSLSGPGNPGTGNESGFNFIRKEKEISLSGRNIAAAGNRTTRELRAGFSISASPQTVVSLLRNTSLCTRWMKGVDQVSSLTRISEDEWITYILYDIPWPLNNQDCIVRYQLSKSSDGRTYQMKMLGEPAYIPAKPGIERISHLSGYWKISDDGKGGSRVEYRIYSLQEPRFPRWATDPIIQQNLIATLASLRELAEKQSKSLHP